MDDEPEIADLIELYLKNEDFTVYKFCTAKEALDCAQNTDIDLAVLDIMLPDISGYTLCRKIRERSSCPIIMLTAKDGEADKITGLTLGADDYVTKPFRPLELAARVKAQPSFQYWKFCCGKRAALSARRTCSAKFGRTSIIPKTTLSPCTSVTCAKS